MLNSVTRHYDMHLDKENVIKINISHFAKIHNEGNILDERREGKGRGGEVREREESEKIRRGIRALAG